MTRAGDEALELAFAHGLPYAGLRDAAHDASLVPETAARAARVVALGGWEDRVRLAAAEPEPDLTAVRPHLGDRRAEIVIAPREEIDAILGPPPPEPETEPPVSSQPAPIEPEPEPEPEPAGEPGEEPSWLAPARPRRGARVIALIAVALVLLAAGAAVAVWLST